MGGKNETIVENNRDEILSLRDAQAVLREVTDLKNIQLN